MKSPNRAERTPQEEDLHRFSVYITDLRAREDVDPESIQPFNDLDLSQRYRLQSALKIALRLLSHRLGLPSQENRPEPEDLLKMAQSSGLLPPVISQGLQEMLPVLRSLLEDTFPRDPEDLQATIKRAIPLLEAVLDAVVSP